jgi:altronate hydrolase
MKKIFIKINSIDNVAIALEPLKVGQVLDIANQKLVLTDDIPFGHKFALHNIKAGQDIIKYGMPIGLAMFDISAGSLIHINNLKTKLSDIESYTYNRSICELKVPEKCKNAQFLGYKRKDGSVGIRNEVWIIPTVGCVNMTAKILADRANKKFAPNVEVFFAYTHNMGCSQMGQDQLITQKILAGLINNPNAGAVLVLGLGCENNNLKNFLPFLGDYDKDRIKFFNTQETENEIIDGLKILEDLFSFVSTFKREPVGIDKLVLGFKCGGSDAFSGISANPLCGKVNDMLVALGAKTILTETPEMFGAETILMNRAKDKKVFDDIVKLINDFKGYFIRYNQTIYENPSPGNKQGGISSLEDKSLGCIQKGGSAAVSGVIGYGQSPKESGLHLLTGSGNDMVSITNLTASGVQMILFTTGRGTPVGAPVPTIKISSNTNLYHHKKNWIDFNAGQILQEASLEQISQDLFDYILNTASGKIKTKNEINGYKEITIFKDGVTL